jgi:hypothetical protein
MIRVLRLLEYTYDTNERAADDMGRWGVPANGAVHHGGRSGGMTIRSAVITELDYSAPAAETPPQESADLSGYREGERGE